MANILESRDFSNGADLVPWIARVACIGDSLTYGGGVVPRDTLPFALIDALNAAYLRHLVWVDNLGLNGANLWHSWPSFRERIDRTRYDAVLFSVCQNDCQIFDMHNVDYGGRGYTHFWQPDTVQHQAAEALIAEFGETCRSRGVFALLYFYTFAQSDVPIVELVEKLAQRHRVPFLNLQPKLSGPGFNREEYCASPFDGHPSGFAHQLAARHVVNEMIRHKALANAPQFTGDLGAAVARTSEALSSRISPEALVMWADKVLTAKERTVRRLADATKAPAMGDVSAARSRIEMVYRSWRAKQAQAVTAGLVERDQLDAWKMIENCYAAVLRLEEFAYCATHYGDDTIKRLSELLSQPNPHYDQSGRLKPVPPNWVEQMHHAMCSIQLLRDEVAELADAGPTSIPIAATYNTLATRLVELIRKLLISGLARSGIDVDDPAYRLVQIVLHTINTALSYTRSLAKFVTGNALRVDGADPISIWTRVEVTVEGKSVPGVPGGVCHLFVDADYRAPIRARHTCRYLAGVEREKFVYGFEIPLLFWGTVRVRLADWDSARQRFLDGHTSFGQIDVFNINAAGNALLPARRVIWKRQSDQHLAAVELGDIRLI